MNTSSIATTAPAPYAITGLKCGYDGKGNPPCRRDIRDLQEQEPEQFNLYLLALRAIQDAKITERLSYFQIAGIHGVPWTDWDNVQGRYGTQSFPFNPNWERAPSGSVDLNGGYCVHDSILFPTWHRPYVMLLEQVLSEKMHEIAQNFSSTLRSKYIKAAESFRLPYWDWLRQPEIGKPSLPDVVAGYDPADGSYNHPKIQVLDVTGKLAIIDNPLFSFRYGSTEFRPSDGMKGMATRTATRRGRRPQDASEPETFVDMDQSMNADLARTYTRILGQARSDFLNLLDYCDDYDQFSNKVYQARTKDESIVSIEKLHDLIHFSGGTFLANLQEASFDPLFWLHHCNIDRMQAIWETLHPTVLLPDTKTASSSYYLAKDEPVTSRTPLKPFHRSTTRGEYWTSELCRDLKGLGYSYPELDWWNYTDGTAYITKVRDTVNTLYRSEPQGYDSKGWPGTKANGTTPLNPKKGPEKTDIRLAMKEIPTDGMLNKPLAPHPRIFSDAGLGTPPKVTTKPSLPGGMALLEAIIGKGAKLSPPTWPVPPERSYIVSVQVEQYALSASFGIYLFLGSIPDTLNDMYGAANRISNIVVLANDPQLLTGCANCQDQIANRVITDDATDITQKLVAATATDRDPILPSLTGMDEKIVVPYLKDNLSWRIVEFKEDVYSAVKTDDPRLKSLVIKVRSQKTAPRTSVDQPAKITDIRVHIEATKGKIGGFAG